MRPGGGKAKGGAFERLVCKKLSLWLSDGKRDDLLWRSAMSGGRATVAHKKGKRDNQVGDISAVDPLGYPLTERYMVECKCYRNIHMESLFLGKYTAGSVLYFWREACLVAAKVGKRPLLIFKQAGSDVYLLAHRSTFIDLGIHYGTAPLSYVEMAEIGLMPLDTFTIFAEPPKNDNPAPSRHSSQ